MGPYLSKQAKAISAQLENTQEKSVQEMKMYVQRLPQILAKKKLLATHTAIAECIKEITDSYEFLDTLQVIFLFVITKWVGHGLKICETDFILIKYLNI